MATGGVQLTCPTPEHGQDQEGVTQAVNPFSSPGILQEDLLLDRDVRERCERA